MREVTAPPGALDFTGGPRMESIKEREIKPQKPTVLRVEVFDPADPAVIQETYETRLHSVRDGFAFTEDGGPYCLDEGWLQCYENGGVRLTAESLAVCKALLATLISSD